MIRFTVVISVYRKDDPEKFDRSLQSIFSQSYPAEEVILAVDGEIGDGIKKVIEKYSGINSLKILYLKKNIGLGASRHLAIMEAKSDYIAVMDSDDISVHSRFEDQAKIFSDQRIDVVGGFIAEFIDDSVKPIRLRKVPLDHVEITSRGRYIQPINHVTIMFKKSIYHKAGGYGGLRKIEDYDLFHRLVISGARFKNIPKVLVLVGVSEDQYSRRLGFLYLQEESKLFFSMYKSGYINQFQLLANLSCRLVYRFLPIKFVALFSKNLMRKKIDN